MFPSLPIKLVISFGRFSSTLSYNAAPTFDVEHGGLRVLGAHIVLSDALVLAQVLLLAAADLQSTCERTTQKRHRFSLVEKGERKTHRGGGIIADRKLGHCLRETARRVSTATHA